MQRTSHSVVIGGVYLFCWCGFVYIPDMAPKNDLFRTKVTGGGGVNIKLSFNNI